MYGVIWGLDWNFYGTQERSLPSLIRGALGSTSRRISSLVFHVHVSLYLHSISVLNRFLISVFHGEAPSSGYPFQEGVRRRWLMMEGEILDPFTHLTTSLKFGASNSGRQWKEWVCTIGEGEKVEGKGDIVQDKRVEGRERGREGEGDDPAIYYLLLMGKIEKTVKVEYEIFLDEGEKLGREILFWY